MCQQRLGAGYRDKGGAACSTGNSIISVPADRLWAGQATLEGEDREWCSFALFQSGINPGRNLPNTTPGGPGVCMAVRVQGHCSMRCGCPVAGSCLGWRGKEPYPSPSWLPRAGPSRSLGHQSAALKCAGICCFYLHFQLDAWIACPKRSLPSSPQAYLMFWLSLSCSPSSTGTLPVSRERGIPPGTGVISDGHPSNGGPSPLHWLGASPNSPC